MEQITRQTDLQENLINENLSRPITQPSDEAVKRYELIPLCFKSENPKAVIYGKVAFDSWAQGTSVALRDATDGYLRRLQLKAKKISLEIVAERRLNQWEFVARIYSGQKVIHDFVLKVGSQKILPFSGGFYQWTSPNVPATIKLLSYEHNIIFDKLSWR